jgi:hypothetical protein
VRLTDDRTVSRLSADLIQHEVGASEKRAPVDWRQLAVIAGSHRDDTGFQEVAGQLLDDHARLVHEDDGAGELARLPSLVLPYQPARALIRPGVEKPVQCAGGQSGLAGERCRSLAGRRREQHRLGHKLSRQHGQHGSLAGARKSVQREPLAGLGYCEECEDLAARRRLLAVQGDRRGRRVPRRRTAAQS